jgi:hypothetical protein
MGNNCVRAADEKATEISITHLRMPAELKNGLRKDTR